MSFQDVISDSNFFLGIPLRIVLTSIDELEFCVNHPLEYIYWSKEAKLRAEAARDMFLLSNPQILAVANYTIERKPVITKDVLALEALDNILHQALSFIEDNTI